jgi:hypothetical protein
MLRRERAAQAASSNSARRPTPAADECSTHGVAIGECGCNGGGARPFQNYTGMAVNAAAPAVPAMADPNVAGNWTVYQRCNPGCYPKALRQWSQYTDALREHAWRPEPYSDPMYDWLHMDTLYSDFITLLPGVSTNIDISPEAGTFAVYYYSVSIVDPTTQVSQVDWQIEQPSVPGCPTPCNVNGPILPAFVERVPQSCCGVPVVAWLDRRSENLPLRTVATNNQAAGNLTAQIQVRGYCCSTRIC